MKTSMLTFSQTGNTLKVGTAIARGLHIGGFEVEQIRFLHRKKWKPHDADLIGIGCPVFESRPAEVVPEYLKLRSFDLTGKTAFVFTTSGGSPGKSLWHLARAATRTGAVVVGGINIRGAATYPALSGRFPDRPNQADLSYAEAFGRAVAANMLNEETLPSQYLIDRSRGGILYNAIGPSMSWAKKRTIPLPKCDPEKCDLCGTCSKECPTDNITIEREAVQFQKNCIRCYRCWHVCPRMAIAMKHSPGKGLTERLVYSEFMVRCFGGVKPDEYVGCNRYRDVLARKIRLKYDSDNPTAELGASEIDFPKAPI